MIACDTDVLVDYLAGNPVAEAMRLDHELRNKSVVLPPVVMTEILSAPGAEAEILEIVQSLPLLAPMPGYWQRAGTTRGMLRRLGHRAALADTLICQSCLDHDVPLLTRDRDFRHFARHAGLKLVSP